MEICFSELGKGATSEAGTTLFRAANVWWRCAQYLLLPLVARCLETIAFISVVVTVLKIVFFIALEC